MKRMIAALLAAVALVCLPGAQENVYAENSKKNEKKTLIDAEELDAGIEDLLKKMKVDPENVSVALEYTATEETYYYNADKWIYTASLCKLPVAMTYSHMLKTGELKKRRNDALSMEKILVYSNYSHYSSVAEYIYGSVESKAQRKQDVEYSGFDKKSLPSGFYSNQVYSARFFLGIIQELYYNSEDYPDVIDYMKKASPEKYFRKYLENDYEIAQKYGSDRTDGSVVHSAGIIYTDSPVLLVIMTSGLNDPQGSEAIGCLSEYLVSQVSEEN